MSFKQSLLWHHIYNQYYYFILQEQRTYLYIIKVNYIYKIIIKEFVLDQKTL